MTKVCLMSPKNLLVGIALGTLLAAGIWMSLSTFSKPPAQPATATVLPVRSPVPAFSLVDHNGAAIDQNVFRGQWDLVFFGFTNCPDVCPITLQVLSVAKQQLQQQGQAPLPRIVLVSVDPDRDTPEKMAGYLSNFGDGNLGVTGDIDEIRKLTDGLGIFFEKRASETDFYSVDHSAVVIVIDPDGQFHALFGSPHKIENFVSDLPLIIKS